MMMMMMGWVKGYFQNKARHSREPSPRCGRADQRASTGTPRCRRSPAGVPPLPDSQGMGGKD